METLNISHIGFRLKLARALGLIVAVFLVSCATVKNENSLPKNNTGEKTVTMGPLESYGPPVSANESQKISNPDQIVLVLDTAMVKGFSCLGVLKTLNEMKVPIHSIYANGSCALIAALYLTQPTLSRVDWALMQFNESQLSKNQKGLSLSRLSSTESRLDAKISEVFKKKMHEELKTPLHIPVFMSDGAVTSFLNKGSIAESLRCALSIPEGLAPATWQGERCQASQGFFGNTVLESAINEGYPLVVVQLGEKPLELSQKLGMADAVIIQPAVEGISDEDFKKVNQAVYSGKKATRLKAKEILSKIGRTEE